MAIRSTITLITQPNPDDQAEAIETTVKGGLRTITRMLLNDEIGFEVYAHDVQILLAHVGWAESDDETGMFTQ